MSAQVVSRKKGSESAQERGNVPTKRIDGIAALHQHDRRKVQGGDVVGHSAIIVSLEPKMTDWVRFMRVCAEADDQQFRRFFADPGERLRQCWRISTPACPAGKWHVEDIGATFVGMAPIERIIGRWVRMDRGEEDVLAPGENSCVPLPW